MLSLEHLLSTDYKIEENSGSVFSFDRHLTCLRKVSTPGVPQDKLGNHIDPGLIKSSVMMICFQLAEDRY